MECAESSSATRSFYDRLSFLVRVQLGSPLSTIMGIGASSAPRYRQLWALEPDNSCSIEKSRGLSQSFTPDYYIHQTLQVTSAMEAEITTPLEAIAHVIDSH